ncbi:hypothetical protein HG530_001990 [Fusarium avenaceum]|nr:hypothetical protein HG530_001990 [Fusarium avenaceum]
MKEDWLRLHLIVSPFRQRLGKKFLLATLQPSFDSVVLINSDSVRARFLNVLRIPPIPNSWPLLDCRLDPFRTGIRPTIERHIHVIHLPLYDELFSWAQGGETIFNSHPQWSFRTRPAEENGVSRRFDTGRGVGESQAAFVHDFAIEKRYLVGSERDARVVMEDEFNGDGEGVIKLHVEDGW